MSGPTNWKVTNKVIEFDDIVNQVKATRRLLPNKSFVEMLEEGFAEMLEEYAPSMIGAQAIDADAGITLKVKRGHKLWTESLAQKIEETVRSYRTSSREPVRFQVQMA